jgi:hypothetical protein
MTFLDAIQSGNATYRDLYRSAQVWRIRGRLYDVQADVALYRYGGCHELATVIRLLRTFGYPLDCGWHRDEQ